MKQTKPLLFLTTSATVGLLLLSAIPPNEFYVHAATKANPNAAFQVNHSNNGNRYGNLTIQFSPLLPAPAPKADGRGAAIEHLQPEYAKSYENDPYLHDHVIEYRSWGWNAMYTELDQKAKENPDNLNTYRLQADAYLVNSNFPESLSQLDQVLRRNPYDIQALAVTSMIQRFEGNKEDENARLKVLQRVSPHAAKDMKNLFHFVEENMYADYGNEPQTNMVPDAIAVFGQSPNSNGTPSSGMLTRLTKAKEMADRFPNAKIVLSGGAVKTPYAEANVMRDWLVGQGVDPNRILIDDQARDTYGNAIGMVSIFEQNDLHNIIAVATVQHLPRAVTTLKAYANRVGYPIKVDSAGGGEKPDPASQVSERKYTYVTAARAAGLYELNDFAKYEK
ncbi:ElyC/SanA/YdcF family protein [Bacillus sp. EB600]|uniref:ElyC/SanA/YdcF family protein n=1 Tax=Bacillus sp. EB600 TaxID=2806345 RepID=UPI002108C038|nr:YdcF family protein [Bacillus sp. EB600]MCQ6282840.1 YdcF family protein [Bacillus sp. EB600]